MVIGGGGRPRFERGEPGDSVPADSSSSEAKHDVETTALVLYKPPPRLEYVFDETVFLNDGEELSSVPHIVGDIVPTILSYCDAATLSRASCVCVEWRRISQCNDLWENLCRERFGVSATEMRPRPDPTKLLYILAHRRLREVCRMNVNPFTGRATTTQSGLGSLPSVPFAFTVGP